eukprot:CAMPEP_0114318004 /NCGR_PEP_ID=MMETSP0059-20121206/24286_1 /TAXON_ID=36894 /ORGANISM="Pyramimonas parkeae, Strain CCMP726" /LENGTH=381 /DNA_ID=CAMNT_0001444535 /DNA_START=211 /DNA_END=1357 /DNA_ORIENTATION=-
MLRSGVFLPCRSHRKIPHNKRLPGDRAFAVRTLSDASIKRCAPPLKAHSAAVLATARVFIEDDGAPHIATSSLDGSLAIWRWVEKSVADGAWDLIERLPKVEGGPVFSLQTRTTNVGSCQESTLLAGLHNKSIVGFKMIRDAPPATRRLPGTLGGHTGWVRTLAIWDVWAYSAACNYLRVWEWDQAEELPSHVTDLRMFTGDLLQIRAAEGYVYTTGVDGALSAWTVNLNHGTLDPLREQLRAHDGRIEGLTLAGDVVYTGSFDGSIRAWNARTLEPLAHLEAAHGGERVHTLVSTPTHLISGGADGCLRTWKLETMVADGIVEHAHRACVRVLNVVGPYTSTVNGPETFGTTDNIRATSRSYMLISGGDEGDNAHGSCNV